VEQAVRKLEDNHWNASNPEKQARSEGLAGQIEEKIEKLQAELATAQAAKNTSAIKELEAAITTQKEWLAVLK
jgi:capsule polysaccharide export protein KpsE/RkpR